MNARLNCGGFRRAVRAARANNLPLRHREHRDQFYEMHNSDIEFVGVGGLFDGAIERRQGQHGEQKYSGH